MYDELIKRLRDSEHEIDCSLCDRDCCYPSGKVHGKCIIIEAADAIEESQGTQMSVAKWIPVTERLPREQESVLVWGSKLGTILLDWRHDNKWCCFRDVTHWMPLPTPPKGEKE